MFADDRDLLVLDPAVFRDAAWASQIVFRGTASASGESLTLSEGQSAFEAALIQSGQVVVIGPAAYEITANPAWPKITISRPRESPTGVELPPVVSGDVSFEIVSFRPQIADVHRRVLRMLGVLADGEAGDGPFESDVTNPDDLRRLEALGALHMVWAGVSAAGGPDSASWARAESYRARFNEERRAVVARLDLDGDGEADVARRCCGVVAVRA